jgi:hypothetical protein
MKLTAFGTRIDRGVSGAPLLHKGKMLAGGTQDSRANDSGGWTSDDDGHVRT